VPGAKITAITPEGRSIVVFNEPGHFGLKKMIDAAKRKRKDNGAFELTWDNSGVSVTANLKIGASTPPPVQAQAAAPSTTGFKRLRLPDTVTAPAPAPTPATADVPAAATAKPGTPAGAVTPATPVAPASPGAPAAPTPGRAPSPVPATMPAPQPGTVIRTAGAQP
jgi:type VI secretion system protein ImpL